MYIDPESSDTERCNYCGKPADTNEQGFCDDCANDPDVIEDLENEITMLQAFNRYYLAETL